MQNNSMMTLVRVILISIVTFLLIMSLIYNERVYISQVSRESERKDESSKTIEEEWWYIADIYYEGSGNYTIYLPTPFTGYPNNLTNNITRMYDYIIDMNETEYGPAFIIHHYTSMIIESGLRKAKNVMLSFEEMIYSSFNNINSRLSVYIELMCTDGSGYEIFGSDLYGDGWESVELEYYSPPVEDYF